MNIKLKINFAGSRIAKLVRVNQFASSFAGKFTAFIFWFLGIISLAIWISWLLNFTSLSQYFGLDQIFLTLFLVFLSIRSFLRFFVHRPEILTPKKLKSLVESGQTVNIVDSFSVALGRALIALGPDLEEVNLTDVLRAIIKSDDTNFIFYRIGQSKSDILSQLEKQTTPSGIRFATLAEQALEIAILENHEQIETGDMLVVLAEADITFSSYLSKLNLTSSDLTNIVYWKTEVVKKYEEHHITFDPAHLHLTGGIGKDWAYGYTPDLDRYSTDLTTGLKRQGLGLELIGHDKEIGLLEQALNRNVGANAILVGEPGIGKRTTLLGFAKKIDQGQSLPNLAHKHVIELNVDLLISGLSGPGEFTERITRVFSQAANAGNIIIYIDGIEKILTSGETGQVDATSVLIPYLSYPEISFIGTTDVVSYSNLIAGNTALSQRFEKIEILEPTDEEMVRILEDVAPRVESHFGLAVTYQAIGETVKLAKRYILDQPNPEKSISILENAANTLSNSKYKVLDVEVVDNYVSQKTNVPVKDATGQEKEVLVNLEQRLRERVVGQTKAIDAVSGALRRARAGVSESVKPIGSFLFLGPTGVGKTETAKALAEVYFGSENSMLRFDMSEYQNKEDVYRLIGSPAGYGQKIEGELIAKVRNNPFSLILFDEIEKASPDILNLFLQILDEGFITSSAGRKAYFKNSIIITTSNAGANLIRKLTSENIRYDAAKKQVVDFIQDQGIFRPEFINRFTDVVYYSPLSKDEIKEVAKMMIRKLAKEIQSTKGVVLKVEMSALEKLATLGYDPEMGARPMARVIEEQVENSLAEKILRGEAVKGSEVVFRLADIK
ncbi:MAG: ATP-dependent Clp protease ATP-binding subunit [Candidatus Berkelbacteria bacterium]|nr:ATP-dependent Clp protease ATP-binding subunit [Candidatus Berkelbacteria bacterium]